MSLEQASFIAQIVSALAVIASLVFPKRAAAHSPAEHDPLANASEEVVAPSLHRQRRAR